jgi:hypothetical protein
MSDRFFSQANCDRCYQPLTGGRTMSWFTDQTICMECSEKERPLKTTANEGCGFIPEKEVK